MPNAASNCNGCVTACNNDQRGSLGDQPAPRGHPEGRRKRRKVDFRGLHALHGCALRGRLSGRLFLHDPGRHRAPRQESVHRLRLLFLCLPVRRPAVSGGEGLRQPAARWTSAPSAPGDPCRTGRSKSQAYGRNRIAEGKLPLCAEMCATKALLGGDGDVVSDIYIQRVNKRRGRPDTWGWNTAYNFKADKEKNP